MSNPKILHRATCFACGKAFSRIAAKTRPPKACSKACCYSPKRHTPEGLARRSKAMRLRNPMRLVETREKMAATMRRKGKPNLPHGWDTRIPTKAERVLAKAIGWKTNVIVNTGHPVRGQGSKSGYPPCYNLDLADETSMTCIEVDGPSHRKLVSKARDAKKTAFLSGIGWKVFRVTNREVLTELPSTISKLKALIPTLRTTS